MGGLDVLRYCAKTKETLVERPAMLTSQKVIGAINEPGFAGATAR
jgi:hypothetical protein